MSVIENLRVGAFTRTVGAAAVREDVERVYTYFSRLRERTGLAGYLSGAEQQMLAIGRALISRAISHPENNSGPSSPVATILAVGSKRLALRASAPHRCRRPHPIRRGRNI